MSMSVRFEIFPSDLDSTADFYTRVLGFQLAADQRDQPQPYLTLERDDVLIGAAYRLDHANREARRPPVGVEIVLEVDDLREELGRVERTGWPLEEALQARSWGLRDFRLLDPSGYYLRITERRASAPAAHHSPSR